MDKSDIENFCAEAVELGYGEAVLTSLAYYMEQKRVDTKLKCCRMSNNLIDIRKINRDKYEDEEIAKLTEMRNL